MFTNIIKTLNNLIERLTSKQLLAITAAIGVLTALMVYTTLKNIESSVEVEKPVAVEMTKAVVAKFNIPRGAILTADMLTVKNFAVESLPKGTAKNVEEFLNLPTRLEIFAGDILTTEKVFTDYRQAGFIGMIPENCRAVTVPVDNVTGIAGLMKAGDYVDVILILSAADGGTHSQVLLQNVLLLSVNRNVNRYVQPPANEADKESETASAEKTKDDLPSEEEKSESDKEVSPDVIPSEGAVGTVTLALKPDEVTKITAATTIGKIYLALRPLKPRSDSMYITETDYYTSTGSSPQPKTLPPIPVIPAPPIPSLPAMPNTGMIPHSGSFEIIQWGK